MEAREADRKEMFSSPDWFDELPMRAVAMPDTMILPDLGQPAIYYAILKSGTHTQTDRLSHDISLNSLPTGGFTDLSLESNANKKCFTRAWNSWVSSAGPVSSSLPGCSHTSLSMSRGQESFPGMRALIRPNRQSQQWNYGGRWWELRRDCFLTDSVIIRAPPDRTSTCCYSPTVVWVCSGFRLWERVKVRALVSEVW